MGKLGEACLDAGAVGNLALLLLARPKLGRKLGMLGMRGSRECSQTLKFTKGALNDREDDLRQMLNVSKAG